MKIKIIFFNNGDRSVGISEMVGSLTYEDNLNEEDCTAQYLKDELKKFIQERSEEISELSPLHVLTESEYADWCKDESDD